MEKEVISVWTCSFGGYKEAPMLSVETWKYMALGIMGGKGEIETIKRLMMWCIKMIWYDCKTQSSNNYLC